MPPAWTRAAWASYTQSMSRRVPFLPAKLVSTWRSPLELLAALLAFLLVASDLDPTGTYAWLPDGPGLTVDESFNVEQGVRLEIGLRYWLLGAVSLRDVFGTADELGPDPVMGYHLPDHPPLGRLLLGVAHRLVTALAMPADWPTPFVVAAARFGSAAAFAATVWLVARHCRRRDGVPAACIATAALLTMPRLVGHAHLAALETSVGLFFTATTLFVAGRWRSNNAGAERVSNRVALVAGLLWGFTLLTKVQGILLPIPIAAWAIWHWKGNAIRPLALFGLAGGAVFFAGWPWLWSDPVGHALQYLGRTTDRLSLPVWYLGRVWADRDVPWHYPFVLFAVTVPIGWQLLGLLGCRGAKGDAGDRLILLTLAFPLVLFAVPGVAVYDGERLFLVSVPLWAVVVGRGGAAAWAGLRSRCSFRTAAVAAGLFVAVEATGLFAMRPAYLSYYSPLAGGLWGAQRLGFEPTYWGDSDTATLLAAAADAVPEGGTLAVAPVLHQFQLDTLLSQSPALRSGGVKLIEYGKPEAADATALLLFNRKASLPEELRVFTATAEPLAVLQRQGVMLGAVYRLETPRDSPP